MSKHISVMSLSYIRTFVAASSAEFRRYFALLAATFGLLYGGHAGAVLPPIVTSSNCSQVSGFPTWPTYCNGGGKTWEWPYLNNISPDGRSWQYQCKWSFSSYSGFNGICSVYAGSCPANSTMGERGCTCKPGFIESGGQCVEQVPCQDGTVENGQCVCPAGRPKTAYGCGPVCEAGRQVDMGVAAAVWGRSGCYDGCEWKSGATVSIKDKTTGQERTYLYPPGKQTGLSCDAAYKLEVGSPPSAPLPEDSPPAPFQCAAGLCPGVVNGKDVCVPCGSDSKTVSEKTETKVKTVKAKDGSDVQITEQTTYKTTCVDGRCTTTASTKSTITAKDNQGRPLAPDGTIGEADTVTRTGPAPDGSQQQVTTETKTQLECGPSGCVKKTTVTQTTRSIMPDGSLGPPVTTVNTSREPTTEKDYCFARPTDPVCRDKSFSDGSSKDVDKASFCKENPESPFCKTGSWTDTGCDAPPACEGDPVQCAVARSVFEQRCLLTKESDESKAYQAARGASAAAVPGLVVDGGALVVSQTGRVTLPAGGCPPDFVLPVVQGKTLVIPLSQYCSVFSTLGYIIIALASFFGVRTILGGR